ncbi:hypothetical protein EON65_32960 [archaeon]|nr:MAG: hypothetical protein EON65_32960 [archaeon]
MVFADLINYVSAKDYLLEAINAAQQQEDTDQLLSIAISLVRSVYFPNFAHFWSSNSGADAVNNSWHVLVGALPVSCRRDTCILLRLLSPTSTGHLIGLVMQQ